MGGPMVDEIRHGTGLQSATYSIAPIYASEYMWIMEKVRETFWPFPIRRAFARSP